MILSDPVDGGWSEFGDWSECSAICGGGTQTRTRECNKPAPEHGGADSEGEDSESQACNTQECPGYFSMILKLPQYHLGSRHQSESILKTVVLA